MLTEAEPVLCALPVEIRDQLPATSRVMAALKTIRIIDTGALSRADTARVRWLQSTLAAVTRPSTLNITNEILRNWKPIDTSAIARAAMANFSAVNTMSALIRPTQFGSFVGTSRFADGYLVATRNLLGSLDMGDLDLSEVDVTPTRDDTAYRVIASASPETAAAIDAAADLVRLPFWSRKIVRNTLAWLLVTVITTAYIAGTVLCPPWGALVVGLLSAGGVTGPSAYKAVAAPRAAPEEHPDDQ